MNINPLFLADTAVDYSKSMEMSEAIPYGLRTVLLGMGVIFAVLIILMAVLSVFKYIFYKPKKDETKATETKNPPEPTPEAVPVVPASDDAELVAVITAAIAAMLDAPQTSFKVVSFRRTAKK